MGKQRIYKRKRRVDEPEPQQRDYPLIRKNILAYSSSDDFEEARREWELSNIIDETDPDFVDHCEICNASGLEKNYQILNKYTEKTYLVGSSCIKRFIIFGDAQTQEESNAIFDRQIRKREAAKSLQYLLPKILEIPTAHELNRFRHSSKFILGSLDNLTTPPYVWNEYIRLLFGVNKPKKEIIQKVSTVLYNPKAVRIKRLTMSTGQKEGQWADKIKSKSRVETSLSRSSAYRVGTDDQQDR